MLQLLVCLKTFHYWWLRSHIRHDYTLVFATSVEEQFTTKVRRNFKLLTLFKKLFNIPNISVYKFKSLLCADGIALVADTGDKVRNR